MSTISHSHIAPAAASGTFTRCMSELCIHTTLEYLNVHERLTCSEVSRIFSSAVRHPALWRTVMYEHDGQQSSHLIALPQSPFTIPIPNSSLVLDATTQKQSQQQQQQLLQQTQAKKATLKLAASKQESTPKPVSVKSAKAPAAAPIAFSLPNPATSQRLPPEWIRSLMPGLHLRECTSSEIILTLPRFSQIRSLHITKMMEDRMNIQPPNDAGKSPKVVSSSAMERESIRLALATLRLESLEVKDAKWSLVDALFGQQKSFFNWSTTQLLRSPDGNALEWDAEPVIWSYSVTLTHLSITESENRGLMGLSARFLTAMSEMNEWTRLERLHCPKDSCHREFAFLRRLFTRERLPQLAHLALEAKFNSNEEIVEFHSLLERVSSLTSLHTYSPSVLPPNESDPSLDAILDIPFPPHLTHLKYVGTNFSASSLGRLAKTLTKLVLTESSMTSVELFSMVGHHNLPHLSELCVTESTDELIAISGIRDGVDPQTILNPMSAMTSLTSLQIGCVFHNPARQSKYFNWFCHLYRFTSLRHLTYWIPELREYRHEPLPLPEGITLTPDQHPLYPQGGIHLRSVLVPSPIQITSLDSSISMLTGKVSADIHSRQIRFGRIDQPQLVYLNQEKFRRGAQRQLQQQEFDVVTKTTGEIEDSILSDAAVTTASTPTIELVGYAPISLTEGTKTSWIIWDVRNISAQPEYELTYSQEEIRIIQQQC